jgi:hypothetical protein
MPFFNAQPLTEMQSNGYNDPSADCIPMEQSISHVQLAQAYVPYQFWCQAYDCQTALAKGTLFPELYSPYHKKAR